MAKRKRKEQEEASVPISSMIDIIFLLIIFFVVTASIDKEIEDEQVTLAAAPHGKPLTKKDPRSVTINVRRDGSVNIGMHQMKMSQLTLQLKAAASKRGSDIPIIIRGDQNTQHGYIKDVMEAITETGLYRVKFDAEIK
jgi:biopolymer transport protein ExbD